MKNIKKIISIMLTVLLIFGTISVSITAFAATVKVTKIALNKTSTTLYTGKTYTLKPTITPSNATNKTVTWKSSNTKIAKVSSNGVVTGINKGTATVTCTAKDGSKKYATCKIVVRQSVTKLTLSKTAITVYQNASYALKATITPTTAYTKTLRWTSSDTKIAKVSSNGVVTGINKGTATITCAATDGSGKTATCKATIKTIPTTGLALSKTTQNLYTGKSTVLTPIFTPATVTNKTVTWKSSNTKVATVDAKGKVTAVSKGSATITCTTTDGTKKSATCVITVIQLVTKITLRSTATLYVSKTYTFAPVIAPTNANNKTVKWTTSNASIATIDSKGVITGIKAGTVTITCTAADASKITAKCVVTVKPILATAITLPRYTENIYVGSTVKLSPTVAPANTTNKTIKWVSNDLTIATVNQSGVVKGVTPGTVTITGTAAGTDVKVNATINVLNYELKITGETTMYPLQSTTLKCTPAPAIPTSMDKTITWKSDNEKIATVDNNGVVTAISTGMVVITATLLATGATATTTINIQNYECNIENTLNLFVGQTNKLNPVFYPDLNSIITWRSTNTNIATVDNNGIITAIKPGETTIIGNSKEACVDININVIVEGYSFTIKTPSSVYVGNTYQLNPVFPDQLYTDASMTWESSDDSVATIDNNGRLTALNNGSTTITATLNKTGDTATCTLTVSNYTVSIDETNYGLYIGGTKNIKVDITPATDMNILWESSNPRVAQIVKEKDNSYTIIAYKEGLTVLTATINALNIKETINVNVSDYTLSVKGLSSLYIGETTSLNVVSSPELEPGLEDQSIIWTSSNPKIAKIEQATGVVTAVSNGIVTITAKLKATGAEAEFSLSVQDYDVEVDDSYFDIVIGESKEVKYDITPSVEKTVLWKSDDESIATVDQNGFIKGMKEGQTVITGTVESLNISFEISVAVSNYTISINDINKDLYMGQTYDLKYSLSRPFTDGITDKKITWDSSDKDVIVVDENGTLTCVGTGYTKITASTSTGSEAYIYVYVNNYDAYLENDYIDLYIGYTKQLTASIQPSTTKTITWTSDDENVASVNSDGVVTAVGEGSATITGTIKELDIKMTASVLVNAYTINTNNINDLYVGEEKNLDNMFSFNPVLSSNIKDSELKWESSDTSVLTVDNTGKIKAISYGSAIITVTHIATNTQGTFYIFVNSYYVQTDSYVSLSQGTTATIYYYIAPAVDKQITWLSADTTIATVDQSGKVTAVKSGTTKVTGSIAEYNIYFEVEVYVYTED